LLKFKLSFDVVQVEWKEAMKKQSDISI